MELVRVTTADGLWLDGSLQSPTEPVPADLPVDACLLVHGTASNFYAPGMLETFSQQARAEGLTVLRINTRGHDGVSSIAGERRSIPGGATFEHVADCRLDLAAWIEFLQRRGFSRIALCGHSMGGVKSAYSMAYDTHSLVKRVILISSPRFHHQTFIDHPDARAFRADFEAACLDVLHGRPDQLLPVSQPMPFIATAKGFLDKYGPEDRYDLVKLLPRIPCPVLYILGTKSPQQSIGFAGLPETLRNLAEHHPRLQLSLVDGANTNYSGMDRLPFERAWAWINKVPELDGSS